MKNSLVEIINRFHNFNKHEHSVIVANKMAKILIQSFGFSDKKFYSHIGQEVKMYDWSKGDGTLFLITDKVYCKFEIGKAYGSDLGWFCPDIEGDWKSIK